VLLAGLWGSVQAGLVSGWGSVIDRDVDFRSVCTAITNLDSQCHPYSAVFSHHFLPACSRITNQLHTRLIQAAGVEPRTYITVCSEIPTLSWIQSVYMTKGECGEVRGWAVVCKMGLDKRFAATHFETTLNMWCGASHMDALANCIIMS
jgi:hypothetical protein